MLKTITAAQISRNSALAILTGGKRCFIIINEEQRVQLVCEPVKGAAKGARWYFICPVTKMRCKALHYNNGGYVHRSAIKDFYNLNKPAWYSHSALNKVLTLKQNQIDAEKLIAQKYFKKYYAGKPTKRYLKCLEKIQAAAHLSMFDIVNGRYE